MCFCQKSPEVKRLNGLLSAIPHFHFSWKTTLMSLQWRTGLSGKFELSFTKVSMRFSVIYFIIFCSSVLKSTNFMLHKKLKTEKHFYVKEIKTLIMLSTFDGTTWFGTES